MARMQRLDYDHDDFDQRLGELAHTPDAADPELLRTVEDIIGDVQRRGDAAVVELTNRFDRRTAETMADLEIEAEALGAAYRRLSEDQAGALDHAAVRLRDYAARQSLEGWSYRDADGNLLGQQITALDRVGVYVPGGKAAYPSSVLMNAIPARAAGVGEIVMAVPMPDGEVTDLVLAAAWIAGVDRVIAMGGAQAVAMRSLRRLSASSSAEWAST